VETPGTYFEQRWASSPDPWDHAGRWYETRKYDLTVAALPAARYRCAVEPACGVGLLTERLATRADAVVASDRFGRAVAEAAARCARCPNVTFEVADVRAEPPDRDYDLAVLGEVLYYFDVDVVVDVLRAWHGRCTTGGHIALVHYRPAVEEHVLTGDDVHALAVDLLGSPAVHLLDPGFVVDVFDAPVDKSIDLQCIK
jgi:SAM-dependent methyltransferase